MLKRLLSVLPINCCSTATQIQIGTLYKITGIKTGYTDRALNNLVSSAVNDEGTELIAVVLGVENYDMVFEYSKMLLEYGFKNYSVQPVIAPNSYITSVPVLKAAGNHNLDILASPEGLKCLLPNNSTKNDYEIEQHILENIEAPVKKGCSRIHRG